MEEIKVNRGCPSCPLWGECADGEASWHCKPDWGSYLRMLERSGLYPIGSFDPSGDAVCEVRAWWEGGGVTSC